MWKHTIASFRPRHSQVLQPIACRAASASGKVGSTGADCSWSHVTSLSGSGSSRSSLARAASTSSSTAIPCVCHGAKPERSAIQNHVTPASAMSIAAMAHTLDRAHHAGCRLARPPARIFARKSAGAATARSLLAIARSNSSVSRSQAASAGSRSAAERASANAGSFASCPFGRNAPRISFGSSFTRRLLCGPPSGVGSPCDSRHRATRAGTRGAALFLGRAATSRCRSALRASPRFPCRKVPRGKRA